jgi:single-stranded DNA-binding protein
MPADTNQVTGTARLATEPKIYRTDTSVVTRLFAIINGGDKTTAVNIVAFGNDKADYTEANLHKGSKIAFEGELSESCSASTKNASQFFFCPRIWCRRLPS